MSNIDLRYFTIQNSLDLLNDLQRGDEAIDLLVSCGREAIQPLALFLKERKPSHIYRPRQRAVEVLAKLGAKDILLEYLSTEKDIKDPVIRFGEEAVENTAARALSEWQTEEVYSTLMAISQSRCLSGAIETLSLFRQPETIPLFIAALGDDMCNGVAQAALKSFGEIAKAELLDVFSENSEGDSPSVLIRKRSAVRILSELNLTSDDWQRINFLMHSDDLEISTTISQMAMKYSDDMGKESAVINLIEAIGKADWYIQCGIQDCLIEHYDTARHIIEREISGLSNDVNSKQDPVLQFLLYIQKRMTNLEERGGDMRAKNILWFDEIELRDIPQVGGKNASLGEMRRELKSKGVDIPDGYAITAAAYRYLIESAGITNNIKAVLSDLDTHDIENLSQRGKKIRSLIYNADLPRDLKEEILMAYRRLCDEYGADTDVAVRSSATAEDLPDASFAGQQETYLNVSGEDALIEACKKCFASLFTDRAISYRVDKGFDHLSVALSIGVQKMVRSDLASSGVIFSIDTETGFKEAVLITGSYGLGEMVVQGTVNPDEFFVFKPTIRDGFRPILQKKLGTKERKMVYSDSNHDEPTVIVKVPETDQKCFCLSDDEILKLAKWTIIIEDHYSQKAGYFKPMDIEWGKDGRTGELFILQARPETVQSQKDINVLETYVLLENNKPLVSGTAVGSKIGSGPVNIIENVSAIKDFKKGQVLVTDMTDPDWEPIMKIAAAIVTNKGGRTCHAAIVSRELGVPCIVGTGEGTKALKNAKQATVSCAEGEIGNVYEGLLKFEVQRINLQDMKRPKTKIMMNVGNPDIAFNIAGIPNDGVGLARLEFIINNIRIHPMALIQFEKVKDDAIRKEIETLTLGYETKSDFFVDKLAQGVAKIAASFYPNDVIVRMSDFKSNEYANLVGGSFFEPEEENPMIGWRGASRYYDEKYRAGFALECKAMKKVREEMGLVNVKLMIPFCRTVDEGKRVVEVMKANGIVQGDNGLELYMMVEIPSNVVLIEEFGKVFDGFSIGSNDLTQLTLGLDRDSAQVAHIFDERNQAVLTLVKEAITKANKMGKKIGICGQAPSDYPEFARFLVECGIDSMSLNADTVMKTTLDILKTEEEMGITT